MMSYEDQICDLYFLLHKDNQYEIGYRLDCLLRSLIYDIFTKGHKDYILYLKTLYLLIGYVRDTFMGHGERDLSYRMIYVWYLYFPDLAVYAFYQFVLHSHFGSWKDIKYFCKFIDNCKLEYRGHDSVKGSGIGVGVNSNNICDSLIDIAISCANEQLQIDNSAIDEGKLSYVSTVSKWIPRENKNSWLFDKFVANWFDMFSNIHIPNLFFSAKRKIYRKMISKNSAISKINDFENEYGYPIGNIIRDVINLLHPVAVAATDTDKENDTISSKWYKILARFPRCSIYSIPIIDTSVDIPDSALFDAIAYSILLAIKTDTYRIMVVSQIPIWIDFEKGDTLCTIVNKIWSACEYRTQANFYSAFDLMFSAIKYSGSGFDSRFFIFSQRFFFDWTQLSRFDSTVVLWNIGNHTDFLNYKFECVDQLKSVPIIFASGNTSGVLLKFLTIYNKNSSYKFLEHVLADTRYKSLIDFFEETIHSIGSLPPPLGSLPLGSGSRY